jgi:hypothetical protein
MASAYELVARMRRDGYSRNRNFGAFVEARADRARRIFRHLAALEQALGEDDAEVTLERSPRGVRLQVSFSAIRARREAFLTHEEFALLCESEAVRVRLGQLDLATG